MNLYNVVKSLDTKTLLGLYNHLTGKKTTKFASREKGEAQTIGATKVAGREAVVEILKELGVEVPVNPLTPVTPKEDPVAKIREVESSTRAAPAQKAAPKPKQKSRTSRGTNLLPPPGKPVACREGTKQAIMLDLLCRPEGITMDELVEQLSGGKKPWLPQTVRSGFGWDMKMKGYGVVSKFDEDGTERFFIVLPKDPEGNPYPIPPHRAMKGAPKADARQTRLELE